ncbi:MAG: site-specific DNA-methyltransferase [Acidimicrobiaceae bacterium]|nr:site-specific DNA-methyltransferase [Acidimicrobiaceae bacterium]
MARPAHSAIVGFHRMLGGCGMLAYLTYMAERLEHCHRLLKPTGSLWLHCDPTASHALKMLLDAIIGADGFRNEVIWSYRRWTASKNRLPRLHDVLLHYAVGEAPTFHPVLIPNDNPNSSQYVSAKDASGKTVVKRDSAGRAIKRQTSSHLAVGDVWELPIISPNGRERLGYQTQKPIKLLRRVIETSSNPGDLVLDPFCGCGTTVDAAHQLGRRWAGIDISSFAIDLICERRMIDVAIDTAGIPSDMRSASKLAADDPFGFEAWAVNRLPGFVPNTKQVADGGIDGRALLAVKPDDHPSRLALAQVKGGKSPSVSLLRDFCGVTRQQAAAVGCYVTLRPSPHGAIAASEGKVSVAGIDYQRMNLWSIADYFEDRWPKLPMMANPYTGKPMMQGSLF